MFKFEKDNIDNRIFVVGCSRSGTTLLQNLIGSQPEMTTFPETAFFLKSCGIGVRRLVTKLGIAKGIWTNTDINVLENVIDRLGREELKELIPNQPILFSTCVKNYLAILDDVALSRGKNKWVEKTPKHLFYIDFIQKHVPNANFVHIIRDGREVVASICKRAEQYPEKFSNQNTEYAIELWNKSISMTKNFKNEPNNYVIKYEKLVSDPKATLDRLGKCLRLKIKNDLNMDNSIRRSVSSKEEWKQGISKKIKNRNTKFSSYFSKGDQNYIKRNLLKNEFYKFC